MARHFSNHDHAEEVHDPQGVGAIGRAWPEPPNAAAYHGLVGKVVRTLDPHTEADQVAIAVQFVAAFGNAVGRGPHFIAEADRHGTNLFAVLVGETAKARKGTSWGQARRIVEMADESWRNRIASGLSSGEGLIWQVRDEIKRSEPIKKKGRVVEYQTVVTDAGIADKRLLVFEGEFALVLQVLGRDGNTLSAVVRNAWDNGDLRTLTKHSPAVASGGHISIIGHVTCSELLRYLDSTEAGNGFANRFLWVCVRRSKLLPEGGSLDPDALVPLVEAVSDALEFAHHVSEVQRDEEARAIWRGVYPALSQGKPGLLGAVTARAEAQVMRLALIYALLDLSPLIRAEHLRAALAMWEYCEASAEFIFGDRLGDPVADTIVSALRQARAGLTRTELHALFGRNMSVSRIDTALAALVQAGKVRQQRDRPARVWG